MAVFLPSAAVNSDNRQHPPQVEEDEEVLAARRALVEAKSPLELSAITSLADLPIPSGLQNMVKGRRGRGAASAPGSRLDVRSLSVKV
jgi:hypothetical protein